MSALLSMLLCLIVAFCSFFLELWARAGAMTSLTIIVMGGCIIYTINKNFDQLRKDLKDRDKKADPEKD